VKKIFEIFRLGQPMSDRALHDGRMKNYSTRYRRSTLLPVPYSVRPDRLERGIRLLRALRLSLAASEPAPRARQCEFEFILRHPA